MTDVTVDEFQFKKKKPVWPWIVFVLGLAALGIFFLFRNENGKMITTDNEKVLVDVHENNTTVTSYTSFIGSDTNRMSLDHAYSSQALTKLTDAVEAMAMEVGYDVKVDITKAKQYGEEITKDPLSTNHAEKIREAAVVLSTALQNLQLSKYPELSAEAADVKIAAEGIEPKTLTLDQRDAVKSFFKKAASLLTKMN